MIEGAVMPSRTLFVCPDPACDWATEWPHPDEATMQEYAVRYGPLEAARVLTREASRHVEDEVEQHFMAHMRGDA